MKKLRREDKVVAHLNLAILRLAARVRRQNLDEAAQLLAAAAAKVLQARNSVGAWRQRAKRA